MQTRSHATLKGGFPLIGVSKSNGNLSTVPCPNFGINYVRKFQKFLMNRLFYFLFGSCSFGSTSLGWEKISGSPGPLHSEELQSLVLLALNHEKSVSK